MPLFLCSHWSPSKLHGSDKPASFISLCTKHTSHRPHSLLSAFALTLCFYWQHWLLFRIFCHWAGYLRVCKMSVCDRRGEGSVVPGGGRPSFMLKAVANIPKGNAPIPKDIWKPPSPNPKPWNPCREQRTQDKKGTNHFLPISEYFVEVQTFPLPGWRRAMLSGNFQSDTFL